MSSFVHLHLHTQYSVLDGAIKLKELISYAKSCGQDAVAMTDHGVMHGAIEFYELAKSAGVKPIIGCEVYITPSSRFEKKLKSQGGSQLFHLTLLAKNKVGYHNLCKLITAGFTEGFYFKPRIDFELLKELNSGLVVLSGCMSGEFASFAKAEDYVGARAHVEKYLGVFGDRYYLEIQPHVAREQQAINKLAREVGRDLGVPLVATNDVHYLSADDQHLHDVLMCVSTGKLLTDEDRIRHTDVCLHFKTADEMLAELPEFHDAIKRTRDIANLCELEFDFSTYHMPVFNTPVGVTLEEQFADEARNGLKERLRRRRQVVDDNLPIEIEPAYSERLDEEIKLILYMGFAGYFLVVSDFIKWAKRRGIPVGPGRGSAAGSLVAYALSITEVDPLLHGLLFERFLNPERISLPDIDIDFCINGRDEVIEYVKSKYGRDRVAQIITFGTLKAKAAIKDVGRVLGMSFAETDRVAKLIPAPRQGFDFSISQSLKMDKRLSEYAEGEGAQLIGLAQKLEGLSRHTSTHAAGLVIADRPVVEMLPLMLDKDQQVVTQYAMSSVEKIGLVKFDFLGLKTLTVLNTAVQMIYGDTGERIEVNELPLDDRATYELISSGRTIGVFQLESSGITEMVSRLKPTCFDDIVAILALYRPGPLDAGMADHFINRKHGREPVKYLHPLLQPILKDTYGIILYQEQIMQIARDMGGYSLGEADLLRRAMGKKKPEEMAKQREVFIAGSVKAGIPASLATDVFDQMETFARYGFNRSHSVAYALISYQTAYLKAHYPKHFMAALMTSEMGDTDKTLKNFKECKEEGIEIVSPDVNVGEVGFSVVDGKIVFGLAALKGVGEKAVEQIITSRKLEGPFKGLLNFCTRLESGVLNRRTVESLIKAGAFDWTSLSRAEMLHRLDDVLKRAQRIRQARDSKQMSMFFDDEPELDELMFSDRELLSEWPINIKLAHEKEALGFYLSGHPLEKFQGDLQRFHAVTVDSLKSLSDDAIVTVGGSITILKLRNTKKGDRYASFLLEDMAGTIEVIVWPDVYQNASAVLSSDEPIVVTGRLDVSDERRTIIASAILSAIELRDSTAKEAIVRIAANDCSADRFESLKSLFAKHKGRCPVKIIFSNPNKSETVLSLPLDLQVQPSEMLCNSVEKLFGRPVMSFR